MSSSDPSAALVLDFDGTVCIGDDPVHFYAEEVAARHPAAADVPDQVRQFLAGRLPVERAADGYQAVHRLSQAAGVSREQFVAAYLASRERLEAGEGDTRAPHGLTALLEELRAARVRIVLVTNSPRIGIERWLTSQDLDHRFDEVVTEAGKPQGMPAILARIADEARLARPVTLGSIGDVWANDVSPAMDRGGTGFFIDRFDRRDGPSSHTGATFEDLLPALRGWAGSLS
ncbi:HAD family hydrolase [Ruania albidiflava]|uniref:HAD family hydrolase n=1 Tax=Ruania albidiflava TaxID=366586 RepID=UPI0023F4F49E|nr:HAD family hydrolase [Ruania albidiflava]